MAQIMAQKLRVGRALERPCCISLRTGAGRGRPLRLHTVAHLAGFMEKTHASPETKKGFVSEMRATAMKNEGVSGEMRATVMRLHAQEMALKERQAKAAEGPMGLVCDSATRQGYLEFLVETKAVFDTLEELMAEAVDLTYFGFRNTGLERGAALGRDIAWICETYGMEAPAPKEDGPGRSYSKLLREMAASDTPAFICHYYNIYFGHTAGGPIIGSKVANICLDGKRLDFYEYDRDVAELTEGVRATMNRIANGWTQAQKNRCLQETVPAFQHLSTIMQTITA